MLRLHLSSRFENGTGDDVIRNYLLLKSIPNWLLSKSGSISDHFGVLQETDYGNRLKGRAPGLVTFVHALAYHFCMALPEAFTKPGDRLFADPCTEPKLRGGCWERRVGKGSLFSWHPSFNLKNFLDMLDR